MEHWLRLSKFLVAEEIRTFGLVKLGSTIIILFVMINYSLHLAVPVPQILKERLLLRDVFMCASVANLSIYFMGLSKNWGNRIKNLLFFGYPIRVILFVLTIYFFVVSFFSCFMVLVFLILDSGLTQNLFQKFLICFFQASIFSQLVIPLLLFGQNLTLASSILIVGCGLAVVSKLFVGPISASTLYLTVFFCVLVLLNYVSLASYRR
ncbi:MAG: hypothetical protein NZO16_00745 [Deltaproteobacteria bacterium]|nr:hypothetical protein [Deltaproteobacteria bacterium]